MASPEALKWEEKYHPELLKLTLEIIENRKKKEETQEDNNSSVVEPMDFVENDSNVVDYVDVVETAQDQEDEISTGLDEKLSEKDGTQSVDSDVHSGQENECPPPPDGEFQDPEEMVETIKRFAQDNGYAICIRRSEKDKKKIFKCDRYDFLFFILILFFIYVFLDFIAWQ